MSISEIRQSAVRYPPFTQQGPGAARTGEASKPASGTERTPGEKEGDAVLTPAEKEFFETLFPGAEAEIRSHQAYSNSGQQMKQSQMGTLIDRKG